MLKVYLSGPITGLTYKGATDWRNAVAKELITDGIIPLDPMRGKNYLENTGVLKADYSNTKETMSSNRGIMTRDHWDTINSDIVLVNLLGAKTVSIGTCMEIAWAWDHHIPVVCAMEPTGNVHEHGMIKEALGFRVASLDEAITIIKSMNYVHCN